MSSMEIGQPSYYNQRYTLGAGIGALVAPANFFNNSRLLNIIRITAGGTVGTPTAVVVQPSSTLASPLANLLRLGVCSSNALDTSVYQVNWVNNETTSSAYPSTSQFMA